METSIQSKLLAIQGKLKAPKDAKNEFGGFMYRSAESILEAVKPILKQEGLTLTLSDEVQEVGHRIYIKSIVTLSDGKNELSTTAYAREAEEKKGMDEAQVTGSASSYARKYALCGLFCIDDNKDPDTQDNRKVGATKKPNNSPTVKQVSMIRALSAKLGLDKEATTKRISELETVEQASEAIKKLQEMQDGPDKS